MVLFIIVLFSLTSCSNADFNTPVEQKKSSNIAESRSEGDNDDFAQVPEAVAGAFLFCEMDESLSPNNVGCAMRTSEYTKSQDSDEMAKEHPISAKNEDDLSTLEFIEDHQKWSWAGYIKGDINDYNLTFEDFENDEFDMTDDIDFISLNFMNRGPYIIRATVNYELYGEYIEKNSGPLGMLKDFRVNIPTDATNIRIYGESKNTFTQKWTQEFEDFIESEEQLKCYKFVGGTLTRYVINRC